VTVTVVALQEKGGVNLENLYVRAREFENFTGAVVDFVQRDVRPSGDNPSLAAEVFADAGKVETGCNGAGVYQGYVIKGNQVPDLVQCGGIANLSTQVEQSQTWSDLDWADVATAIRQGTSTYDSKVYSLPIDADYMATVVREDLAGNTTLDTWEQWVAFAESQNGTDMNGDGKPDHGACIALGPAGHFSVFGVLMAIAAPHLQLGGTSQGAFFNTDTLEPKLTAAAMSQIYPDAPSSFSFETALALYKRLVDVAVPGVSAKDAWDYFKNGSCSTWISLPGFVYKTQDTKFGTTNMLTRNVPNATMARVEAPGVPCPSRSTCPYASDTSSGLVSRAPFLATSGFGFAISSKASAIQQQLLFELFTYVSAPEQSNPDVQEWTVSDPFRLSQLDNETIADLVERGWDEPVARQYLEVVDATLNHPNAALDLRVPGLGLYMSSLLDATDSYVHGTARRRRAESADAACEAASDAWQAIPLQLYGQEPAATNTQLDIYRAQLGLPQIVRDTGGGGNEEIALIVTAAVGGMAAAVILGAFAFWIVATLRRKRALERQAEATIKKQIVSAVDALKEIQAPLALIRASDFLEIGSLQSHEALRDKGVLHFVDTTSQFIETVFTRYVTVFFSHQWLAFGDPDPRGEQYAVMVKAARSIAALEKVPLEDIFLWVDVISISQSCRSVQTLAINSLPCFASLLKYFVTVCPTVKHADTGAVCNKASYHERCWCRAELMSFWARNGTERMFYATGGSGAARRSEVGGEEPEGMALEPMAPEGVTESFVDAIKVFHGSLSCCRLGHAGGTACCDKEELMLPMLGLYAEIYAKRDGACKRINDAIEGHLDEIFPRTFEYCANGTTVQKLLFGDLVTVLRHDIDQAVAGGRTGRPLQIGKLQQGTSKAADAPIPHGTKHGSKHASAGPRHGVGGVKHGLATNKSWLLRRSSMSSRWSVGASPDVRPVGSILDEGRLAQLRRAAGSGRLNGADATSQSSDRSTDGEAEAEPKDEAAKLPKPPPLEQEVV